MPGELRPYVHVITPGDHYSPLTGSAVPTVVDGLSRFAPNNSAQSMVVVDRDTYPERYDSAQVIEYAAVANHLPASRYIDPSLGRLGLPRFDVRRTWAASLVDQRKWPSSIIFAHNGPQLVPVINIHRHRAVLYAHNALLQTYRKREVGRTLGTVSLIVCVSDFLAQITADSLTRDLVERIRVVPNGVDCRTFRPGNSVRSGDRLNVVFVGRTIPQKGPNILLEALAILNRDDVGAEIIGSHGFDPNAPLTAYERHLRELARPLGDRIRFRPTVPRHHLPGLMRAADIIVVPSRWSEPFGLTVLEGMASGVPVIASAVGGIPQAMGPAGIQVPPDDPEALAEALDFLALDESRRQGMAQACRQHAEAHDWGWSRALLDTHVANII